MDGYDIETKLGNYFHRSGFVDRPIVKTYRVYTITRENNRTVKHYHNGYSSYKQMILNHPELVE